MLDAIKDAHRAQNWQLVASVSLTVLAELVRADERKEREIKALEEKVRRASHFTDV